MLRFCLRLDFDPHVLDEATQTFRSLVGPVRAEPGCSSTRLLTDMDGSGAVTWTEEWRGWDAFERHLEAKTFRRMVAVMELADRPPTVEIDEVTERHGFEVVALGGSNRALPLRLPALIRASAAIRGRHRREPFDAVHALWLSDTALVGWWSARRMGTPFIATVMGQAIGLVGDRGQNRAGELLQSLRAAALGH